MKELIQIQKNLVVAKERTQQNYKYRTVDDILEAVKSIMPEGCFITMSDSVENIGERNYICSTATFNNGNEKISTKAYAWEPSKLAAMSMPQITGSCSSYARKGALCGLLMIDDSKEVDSMSETESRPEPMATIEQINSLTSKAVELEASGDKRVAWLNKQISTGMTFSRASEILEKLK